MTTKEEFVASRGGRGGGGRGGRGGREGAVQGVAVGGNRTAGGRGRGRGLEIMAVNHDRWMALSSPQPQPAQQQNHQQRQQQQQVKLSHHHHHYYNRSTPTKKVISGPYTHLFCSERHTLASSRVLYPRGKDHFLLPHDIIVSMINNNSTNNSTNNEWPQMIN